MSELSYKELQEKGVFDVPYKAFEFMQSQQAIIADIQNQLTCCREENKGLVGKVSELKKHAEMLIGAAKSWTYSEREKNILLSQADDLDRILNGEKALQGGDQNTKNKAQSIENTGHEGGDQKALRGEHG